MEHATVQVRKFYSGEETLPREGERGTQQQFPLVAPVHAAVTAEGIDIVLVIDVSSSMLAEDLDPNRLTTAVLAEYYRDGWKTFH